MSGSLSEGRFIGAEPFAEHGGAYLWLLKECKKHYHEEPDRNRAVDFCLKLTKEMREDDFITEEQCQKLSKAIESWRLPEEEE